MDLLGNANNYIASADVVTLIKMDQAYKLCYIFSYSASSEFSGITHNATAFVGCDHRNNRYRMRTPIFSQVKICLHKMADFEGHF